MATIKFLELHCNVFGGATVELLFQNQTIWGPGYVSTGMINLGSLQSFFYTNGAVDLYDVTYDVTIPNGVTHPPNAHNHPLRFNAPSGSYTVVCDVF